MNRFKRWTLGVFGRVDDMLAPFENHEALAQQALTEMRRHLARAHAQLGRVRRTAAQLERERTEAESAANRWRERARSESQQTAALECLKRSRHATQEAERLAEREQEQRDMIKRLEATVHGLEDKYRELKGKRQVLSSRQAAASAADAIQVEAGQGYEVEDIFERWEIQVSTREYEPGVQSWESTDALEEGYATREEQESLLQELLELQAPKHDETEGDAS